MSDANSIPLSETRKIEENMESEDEFRLQWNDHKNTLVTVFETLLESGTLVDCSLAAEGRFLKAHKVVLSACSPYFELLFSEHKEKHPILILKDVKFQELKALMDYMYRGEVNIPQDRLQALLETAESLQIKGLGGCKSGAENTRLRHKRDVVDAQKTLSSVASFSRSSRSANDSVSAKVSSPSGNNRTGSVSPTPRKRMRHQLPSASSNKEDSPLPVVSVESLDQRRDIPLQSGQSRQPPIADISIIPTSSVPVSSSSSSSMSSAAPSARSEWTSRETERPSSPRLGGANISSNHQLNVKTEPPVEILLQPKTEYVEEIGDEDTTENSVVLDDSDYAGEPRSGPSHEDGSSNQGPGFAPWLSVAEWAVDEMPPQQPVGTYRDIDGFVEEENFLYSTSSTDDSRTNAADVLASMISSASASMAHPPPQRHGRSLRSRTVRIHQEKRSSPRSGVQARLPRSVSAGRRRHECSVCGAVFGDNCRLQRHARVHTGEKPYRCDICGRFFADRSNCNKHRACMHGLTTAQRRGLRPIAKITDLLTSKQCPPASNVVVGM